MTRRDGLRPAGDSPSAGRPSIGCYVKDEYAEEYNIARSTAGHRSGHKRPRSRLWLVGSLVWVVIIGGVVIGFQRHAGPEFKIVSEIKDFGMRALALVKFPIEEVHIVGHQNTAEKAIIQSLGDIWDHSVAALNTLAAQKRIEKLPWVKRAVVERVFPHGINIFIEERLPVGRFVTIAGTYVFDRDGTVIEKIKVGDHLKLPIYEGAGAPKGAIELQEMLTHFDEVASLVSRFSRIEERRWTLVLSSGMKILLPETQVEMALSRLRALQVQHNILNREVAMIDLRLTDRVTLRPKNSDRIKVLSPDRGDRKSALATGDFPMTDNGI